MFVVVAKNGIAPLAWTNWQCLNLEFWHLQHHKPPFSPTPGTSKSLPLLHHVKSSSRGHGRQLQELKRRFCLWTDWRKHWRDQLHYSCCASEFCAFNGLCGSVTNDVGRQLSFYGRHYSQGSHSLVRAHP